MNPVTESLLEQVAADPYPQGHTSRYWREEGEKLSIRRQGAELQFTGFGIGTAGEEGLAWNAFHALERASYRGVTSRLRSYGKTWAALRQLARDLSIRISYDIWKSAVILAVLEDHWQEHRLSPRTFVTIGDGSGLLGALIRRFRPGSRMFCIDLPKGLAFQSYFHGRADARARLCRPSDPGSEKADLLFLLPQEIDAVPGPVDCAINIASMQEMDASSIQYYFRFLRQRSGPGSRFYCVNREAKELPGGETTRIGGYPWVPGDKIFLDGPCPYYTHYFSRCKNPAGPRWLGVRVPFVNGFDGPMRHRLVRLEPLP